MRDTFDWQMPVSVTFGAGCADCLGAALGAREALVLAFESARTVGLADRWGASLGKQLVDWVEVADGLSSIGRARDLAEHIWPQLA